MSLKCTQPPTPLPIYLSPAPSRGLAIRGDSVQAGAIRPESLRGDHSAESVRFEYWQVNFINQETTHSLFLSHWVVSMTFDPAQYIDTFSKNLRFKGSNIDFNFIIRDGDNID